MSDLWMYHYNERVKELGFMTKKYLEDTRNTDDIKAAISSMTVANMVTCVSKEHACMLLAVAVSLLGDGLQTIKDLEAIISCLENGQDCGTVTAPVVVHTLN